MEAQDLHISDEHFTVEDLLDFPNEDDIVMNDGFFTHNNNSNDSTISATSSASGNDNRFSNNFACRSFSEANFSGELCVPYDDVANLEWLSHFVEDSFSSSSSNLQNLHFIPEPKLPNQVQAQPEHHSPITAKAQRSKRSRPPPCDWSSRLLMLNPITETSSCTSSELNSGKTTSAYRKNENTNYHEGRKCLHCGSEKTPQWRTGPMGPKTLCNACGVRFKSGRLVPEYRPAASPTFVSAKHSNSHRKVLELRRQKEMMMQRNQPFIVNQSQMFNVSDGGDYLMRHGGGIDYGHVM